MVWFITAKRANFNFEKATAMVRSALSGPTGTIGSVRLVATIRASSTSTAAMPT
tara:strand:- start:166 stop:327 length:162 start_codon:yes stop_codon:yes gene_type:complete